MKSILRYSLALTCVVGWALPLAAQSITVGSFRAMESEWMCGIGRDVSTGNIWVSPCDGDEILVFSAEGEPIASFESPGEPTHDMDIAIPSVPMTFGSRSLPAHTPLLIKSGSTGTTIYAIDRMTGAVIDSLVTAFGAGHVDGGSYHPNRRSIFLVHDSILGNSGGNMVAEINVVSGRVVRTFDLPADFHLFEGDLEISNATGHLLIMSDRYDHLLEICPAGNAIGYHWLSSGLPAINGFAYDSDTNHGWFGSRAGFVFELQYVPSGSDANRRKRMPSIKECDNPLLDVDTLDDSENNVSAVGVMAPSTMRVATSHPNPFSDRTAVTIALDRAQPVRVVLYDVAGRELRVMHDGAMEPGERSVTIEAADLPDGVYIVKVTGEDFSAAQRIVRIGT